MLQPVRDAQFMGLTKEILVIEDIEFQLDFGLSTDAKI